MADTNMPEGTDTIISDAEMTGLGGDLGTGGLDPTGSDLGGSGLGGSGATGGTALGGADAGMNTGSAASGTSDSSRSGVKGALKTSSEKLRSTASDKAMSFVGQGIERSSGALTNVSSIIGDTAANLDERLGQQYGDYARNAAQAIERFAGSLSTKNPEELLDDARSLVRKSPSVALAGAAILGFALVRVVKSGIEGERSAGAGGGSSSGGSDRTSA